MPPTAAAPSRRIGGAVQANEQYRLKNLQAKGSGKQEFKKELDRAEKAKEAVGGTSESRA